MLNEFAENTSNPTSKKIIIVVGIVNLFVMIGLIIYSFYAWSTQHDFLSLGFLIYLVSLTAVQKVLDVVMSLIEVNSSNFFYMN